MLRQEDLVSRFACCEWSPDPCGLPHHTGRGRVRPSAAYHPHLHPHLQQRGADMQNCAIAELQ